MDDARDIATQDIAAAKRELVEDFALFDDWTQRYEYIIELGRALPGLPDALKIPAARVPGCQSQVWFYARRDGGRVVFEADSDAMIVRGLIAILLRVYSGRTAEEILATPPDFFEVMELGSHLSGSRANGLHAMVVRIQAFAAALQSAEAETVDPATLG